MRVQKTVIFIAWSILWHLFFRDSGLSEMPDELMTNCGMSILLAFGTTAVTISVLAMLLPKKNRHNVDPVILLAVLSSVCGLLFGFVNGSLTSIKYSIEYYGAGTTPAELAVCQHYCELLGFLSVVLNLSGYAFLVFSLSLIILLVIRIKGKVRKVTALSRSEKIAGFTALIGWLHFGLSGQLTSGFTRFFNCPWKANQIHVPSEGLQWSVGYPTAKTAFLLVPLLVISLFISWRQIPVPKAKSASEPEETSEGAKKNRIYTYIRTIFAQANKPAFILALVNLFLLSGLSLYETAKLNIVFCPGCPPTEGTVSIAFAGAATAAVLLVLSIFSRKSKLINLFALLLTLAGSSFSFYLLLFRMNVIGQLCWGCTVATFVFFGLLLSFVENIFSRE
ncbi:MAG: hypothetical protein AB1374_12805 [Bacillota bacterium]